MRCSSFYRRLEKRIYNVVVGSIKIYIIEKLTVLSFYPLPFLRGWWLFFLTK